MFSLNSHVEAAVYGPDLSGDVRRPVGREEGHHAGDLLGLAEPNVTTVVRNVTIS
jgi:hypothetical protein